MRKADGEQIARNIARVIYMNEKKVEQLFKLQGICITYTSDDHIRVICELHHNGIIRYLLNGTMCSMVVTIDENSNLIRLPRGSKPVHEAEAQLWISDIQKYITKWQAIAE